MMELKTNQEKGLLAPEYMRSDEEQMAREINYMLSQITQQYNNQVLKKLNKGTVEKFSDAQIGNYSVVLNQLTNQVNAKILKRFSKDRIKRITKGILERSRNTNGTALYSDIERAFGIPTKQLLTQEGLNSDFNALYQSTAQWVETLRDDHLKSIANNSLRMMTEHASIESITKELGKRLDISSKKAENIARQQVVSFNGLASNIRYKKLGVTHGQWIMSKDERVRHSHKDRDKKFFKLSEGLYSEDDGKFLLPGADYNCFPGNSQLNNTSFCEKLYRRWFTGKLTNIVFSDGVVLRATPNHPVLTDKGFKPAHLINSNDNIIRAADKSLDIHKLYGEDVIPTFEQIFSAFDFLGVKHSVSGAIAGKFHGDISDSNINIIELDSLLMNVINPSIRKKLAKFNLSRSDEVFILESLTCKGEGFFLRRGFNSSFAGDMSVLDLVLSSILPHLTPLELFGFALGSWGDASIDYNPSNRSASSAIPFRNCIFAFSVLVSGRYIIDKKIELTRLSISGGGNTSPLELPTNNISTNTKLGRGLVNSEAINYKIDSIVESFDTDFSGHIYNLQTVSGNYTASTAVVSNCRCTFIAVIPEE